MKRCSTCGDPVTCKFTKCDTCRARQARNKRVDRKEIRAKIISFYGGKCACCGESNEVFLDIDHIEGGGNRHRREFKNYAVYIKWIDETHPDFLQLLCKNCNWAKFRYGTCPHESHRQLEEFLVSST